MEGIGQAHQVTRWTTEKIDRKHIVGLAVANAAAIGLAAIAIVFSGGLAGGLIIGASLLGSSLFTGVKARQTEWHGGIPDNLDQDYVAALSEHDGLELNSPMPQGNQDALLTQTYHFKAVLPYRGGVPFSLPVSPNSAEAFKQGVKSIFIDPSAELVDNIKTAVSNAAPDLSQFATDDYHITPPPNPTITIEANKAGDNATVSWRAECHIINTSGLSVATTTVEARYDLETGTGTLRVLKPKLQTEFVLLRECSPDWKTVHALLPTDPTRATSLADYRAAAAAVPTLRTLETNVTDATIYPLDDMPTDEQILKDADRITYRLVRFPLGAVEKWTGAQAGQLGPEGRLEKFKALLRDQSNWEQATTELRRCLFQGRIGDAWGILMSVYATRPDLILESPIQAMVKNPSKLGTMSWEIKVNPAGDHFIAKCTILFPIFDPGTQRVYGHVPVSVNYDLKAKTRIIEAGKFQPVQ